MSINGGQYTGDVKANAGGGAISTGSGKAISSQGTDSSSQYNFKIDGNLYLQLGTEIDFKDFRTVVAETVLKELGKIYPRVLPKAGEFAKIIDSSSDPVALDHSVTTVSGMTADYSDNNNPDDVKKQILKYSYNNFVNKTVDCPNCGIKYDAKLLSKCPNCSSADT